MIVALVGTQLSGVLVSLGFLNGMCPIESGILCLAD